MLEDTIHLLEDCSAGLEMAMSTLDGLLPEIRDHTLRGKLHSSLETHQKLRQETRELLQTYGGREKSPGSMALGMAWMKINGRMAVKPDDETAANLIAEGCDGGVRSLSRSRNRYGGAEEPAVRLAQSLIRCEERLSAGMRPYL